MTLNHKVLLNPDFTGKGDENISYYIYEDARNTAETSYSTEVGTSGDIAFTYNHTEEQKSYIRETFLHLDKLIDLDFTESDSREKADITIIRTWKGSYSTIGTPRKGEDGYTYVDPSYLGGGVDYYFTAKGNLELSSDALWRDVYLEDAFDIWEKHTINHEIGHALGLSHPHDNGDHPDFTREDTIMSYNGDVSGQYKVLDLMALLDLWGREDDGKPINTKSNSFNLENEYALSRISSISSSAEMAYEDNAYAHKFFNLGKGRIGIQEPLNSGINEVTAVEKLVFQDKVFSPIEDILSVFEQVKGIDDITGAVFRLYSGAFDRLPDSDGLRNWINANTSKAKTFGETAEEFVKSEEFKVTYGDNLTDKSFLTALYNNVLGRDPDQGGLDHYLGLLQSGKSRGASLIDFSESPENKVNFTEVTGLG